MLKADARTDGLWINPDWRDSEPGTFAVIIGVSKYTHLDKGEKPVRENYGLGQLSVSALTAHEFFNWLAKEYQIEGCPVAKAWLLLSPTDAELAYQPQLGEHALPANFQNCEEAIASWWAQMLALNKNVARESRSMFFFSGHGLEMHIEKQILLPSDYLHPPAENWNKAISTQNIKTGLASLEVPRHFFFIDACRSGHRDLRAKKITGASILREDDENGLVNPAQVTPILYATASGQQAFQQPDPEKGLSIYGRALLDGLAGKPDIELKQQQQHWSVNLYPLQSFVTGRVNDILKLAKEEVVQPVKLGGSSTEQTITHLELDQLNINRALSPQTNAADMQLLVAAGARDTHERSDNVARQMNSAYQVKQHLSDDLKRSVWANNFDIGHDLFGSEQVTQMWSKQIRIFALDRQAWLDGPNIVQVHEISRSEDTRYYQVELSISNSDPIGYWIELVDYSGVAHGCVLPGDRDLQPRYILEFDLPFNDYGPRTISRLEAYLALNNPEPLAAAAHLWSRYRTSDISGAINYISQSALSDQLGELEYISNQTGDLKELEELVRHKLRSPLTATIAALILLRANRLDLLHNWLRNLANWCEERTDGPALWAEQCMRQASDRKQAVVEAASYLVKLNERGLPQTNEGLSYAAALSERLLRAKNTGFEPRMQHQLEDLKNKLDDVMQYFNSSGLFASYTGLTAGASPIILIGKSTVVASA